jgi:DHA1 family bicyclomycin/chloramphenicol resistance-like MFS transporter
MQVSDLTKPEHRWFLWVTMATLAAFTAIATDLYLPAFTQVATDFDVTTKEVQFTLFSFFVGMAFGQLIWGPFSDRHGRKSAVILGIAIFILASIACVFAPNLWFLVIARAVQAFGGSVTMLASRAIVRDLFTGNEMARTMSAVSSIFMAAPILAPTLGAGILAFGSWHLIFVGLAIFGALAGLNFMRMPETLSAEARTNLGLREILGKYGQIAKNVEFRFAIMQVMSQTLMLFTYVTMIPSVMMVELGLTPGEFGIMFGTNALALIAGSQVNFRILKRVSVRKALKWFVIVQASGAFVLLFAANTWHSVWVIVPILMVTIGVGSSIAGNSTTLALAPFTSGAAQASGVVGIAQSLAAALISGLLSLISGEPLIKMTFTMATIATIAITVLIIRERRLGKDTPRGIN